MSGYLGDLNQAQDDALVTFRKVLGQTLAGTKTPVPVDVDLLRFLRARQFSPEKARDMYLDMLAWRKAFGADTIRQDFSFPELPRVKEVYQHAHHKIDKQGRPLYIERVGVLDTDKLLELTTIERLLKYHVREWENLVNHKFPACSKKAGKYIGQSLTIIDLKGLSIRQFNTKTKSFVQTISNVDQNNYPEHLGQMLIVNAPLLFKGVWKVIQPWLDKRTQKKIQVLGSDYQGKLLELVDAENLPDFLGGKCTCAGSGGCMFSDDGPWQDSRYAQCASDGSN
eukprot:jgi/Chlat1/4273/Chrsp29S00323